MSEFVEYGFHTKPSTGIDYTGESTFIDKAMDNPTVEKVFTPQTTWKEKEEFKRKMQEIPDGSPSVLDAAKEYHENSDIKKATREYQEYLDNKEAIDAEREELRRKWRNNEITNEEYFGDQKGYLQSKTQFVESENPYTSEKTLKDEIRKLKWIIEEIKKVKISRLHAEIAELKKIIEPDEDIMLEILSRHHPGSF